MTSMTIVATALMGMVCAAGEGAPEGKPVPAPTEPGLVMTFDDTTVANWVAAMPVFEKHGARATFFISLVDKFTPEQWEGLHKLRKAGHAIGCHGLRFQASIPAQAQQPKTQPNSCPGCSFRLTRCVPAGCNLDLVR